MRADVALVTVRGPRAMNVEPAVGDLAAAGNVTHFELLTGADGSGGPGPARPAAAGAAAPGARRQGNDALQILAGF